MLKEVNEKQNNRMLWSLHWLFFWVLYQHIYCTRCSHRQVFFYLPVHWIWLGYVPSSKREFLNRSTSWLKVWNNNTISSMIWYPGKVNTLLMHFTSISLRRTVTHYDSALSHCPFNSFAYNFSTSARNWRLISTKGVWCWIVVSAEVLPQFEFKFG